jgi:hypothetical protein
VYSLVSRSFEAILLLLSPRTSGAGRAREAAMLTGRIERVTDAKALAAFSVTGAAAGGGGLD